MTRRSAPKGASPEPGRQAQSKRQITRRWTDLATNEPTADHADPAYVAALVAAVDRGELEEVEG